MFRRTKTAGISYDWIVAFPCPMMWSFFALRFIRRNVSSGVYTNGFSDSNVSEPL
jgi:hypothetical protein